MKQKEISLKTGTLIIPENFIVIEETRTDNSDYAGVIAEKHRTIPYYVVFSDKPISLLTAEEEEAIYAKCCKICPAIKDVLSREITAVLDEKGNLENKQEWLASVRLGLFEIPDKKQGEELFLGTAVYRRRE